MNKTLVAQELLKIAKECIAKKAIELVQIQGAIAEKEPKYKIMLNGEKWGELYFNTKGYVAERGIPVPSSDGSGKAVSLTLPEKSLSTYKSEIAKANKEWANLKTAKEVTGLNKSLFKMKDDIEFVYDPISNFLQIGMGGEWWSGKINWGRNIFKHRKESVDEAYKPVFVDVKQMGQDTMVFEVSGGFGITDLTVFTIVVH